MFKKHIEEFNENINNLRDFVNILEPFLTEKVDQHQKYISPVLQYAVLNETIKNKSDWKEGEKEKIEIEIENAATKLTELYGTNVDLEDKFQINVEQDDIIEADLKKEKLSENEEGFEEEKNVTEVKMGKKLAINIKVPKEYNLHDHFNNISKMHDHIKNLYKTSFISLLSSVEWFFSQILHFYYDKHPEASGIQKKTLTLSELKNFGNVEDAEKFLIDTKIEEILRGNFESWMLLLKNELNLKLTYNIPIEKQLIEFYQRRNLIVHNGGIVNSIYISKVDKDLLNGIVLGEELKVEKDYLNNAISKLQLSFLLIAFEIWKSLDKEDKTRGNVLGEIIYENLLESNWELCESLSYFMKNDSRLEVTDKIVATLNNWLCRKRNGDFENVKKDLKEADYSDKKEIFQLGLFALLEDEENFFEILPAALDSQQLNIERLEKFPIFKEMRDSDLYEKFKANTKYFNEPNNEIIPIVD